MRSFKTQSYSHHNRIHDNVFQVAFDGYSGNPEKGTVLLVPAPGSSPLDVPSEGKENQRVRLATKIKQDGYTVLTMIPPGKPHHYVTGKHSKFSWGEYASCIESVLYRDFCRGSLTDVVTSSLGQTATILALDKDMHEMKHQRKIIIGAPIDSLQHVFQVQQNYLGEQSKEKLIQQYALKYKLELDSYIDEELKNNYILTAGIKNLIDNGYKNISIYGNKLDLYYTGNNEIDSMKTHVFQDDHSSDPFYHRFSEKNAEEAPQLVKDFLNDKYVAKRILHPNQGFINGFYHTRSGVR